MSEAVRAAVEHISQALSTIPVEWTERQRLARCLLRPDPLERLVPEKLLAEGLVRLAGERHLPPRPTVLFMDRAGGGDGARAAAALMPVIAEQWPGFSLIHVAFATPPGGLGTLVRTLLVRAGAEHGVQVHVAAHNRPIQGLAQTEEIADRFTTGCDLVITFAPGGVAGLMPPSDSASRDRLLERSHLAVVTYPDPEAVVSQLPELSALLGSEPGLDALRFWLQVRTEQGFEDLGTCVLGEGGDAEERLWVLLDNARRKVYRVLVAPQYKRSVAGDPLVCPCKSAIEEILGPQTRISRVMPAGNRFVAVARGEATFS